MYNLSKKNSEPVMKVQLQGNLVTKVFVFYYRWNVIVQSYDKIFFQTKENK